MYRHTKTTKRIATLQLFVFLDEIFWCVLKTTVDLFKNQPMTAYCGTE
jgi:hypothetical protein